MTTDQIKAELNRTNHVVSDVDSDLSRLLRITRSPKARELIRQYRDSLDGLWTALLNAIDPDGRCDPDPIFDRPAALEGDEAADLEAPAITNTGSGKPVRWWGKQKKRAA